MRPLSHSSISMYLECPQKYKFRYIDKLPEKPKAFFSFGRSVHSALEFFYNVPALPAPQEQLLGQLSSPPTTSFGDSSPREMFPRAPTLEQVLACYKEKWVSEGYKDAAQEAEYFADGERILREFYAKHIPDFKPPFFTEYRFDIQVDGIPVMGFVDRIDKVDKDRIAIIDYKTGKSFDEDRVKTDAQLTMYQMACEELLGLKVDSLTFYHLNSLTPVTTSAHSSKQICELRQRVVTVADSIQKELFEPQPEERKCTWCDFKPHCPVFRDQYAGGVDAETLSLFGPRNGDHVRPKKSVAPAFESGDDEELAALVDRYGRLMEQRAALDSEAEELSEAIAARLRSRGWVRAFGYSHEVSLASEPKWEFQDKSKILDLIRKAGRWEDILAPSAPLVTKLMEDPSVPPYLRERLSKLGKKTERDALRLKKIESESAEMQGTHT